MALAQKKTSLEKCPDVSQEAKVSLESASEPPIRTITVGSGENKIELGGETVLFRHEKTFYHACGLGVEFSDNLSPDELKGKIERFNKLEFDRVGQKVKVELAVLKNDSKDKAKFISLTNEIVNKTSALLILLSDSASTLEEAVKTASARAAIGKADSSNYEQLANISKSCNVPLIVSGKNLDETAKVAQNIAASGHKDLILDLSADSVSAGLENLTQARRLALKKNFRPLGYPTIMFVSGTDRMANYSMALAYIAKYAGVVILPDAEDWQFLSLVTLRQNIYTDPQKPVTVEPKLYSIGGQPTDKSPVLVTTNFSLTYFTVEPEIINSKIPSWLLVVEAEGLSVLTAWAAEKFTPEKVVDAMKKFNLESVVSHKKLVIPGYVSVMSGKLNEISGWEVLVGPREASGIPKYLKTTWS
jgi:acetyl-CoA decarbonylase/synthase complex subunit gamma